jgi:hypothetical protein
MSAQPRSPHGVYTRLAASAVLLACLWYFTVPAEPSFRACGFHWLTGRPCPLCGLTRSMFALAKGHLREGIHFNALSPLGFAMLFSLFWNGPVTNRLWTAGLAAFVVYGICRVAVPTL